MFNRLVYLEAQSREKRMLHLRTSALAFAGLVAAAFATPSTATQISPPYFGTSYDGGGNGNGYIYEVTQLHEAAHTSDLTVIYNFCSLANCHDGRNPKGNIIAMSDGTLVGTTSTGGENGAGTLFVLTPSMTASGVWDLTYVYSFCNYFEDCGRYGGPSGTLTLIGTGLVMGSSSGGPNGKGMLWTFDVINHVFTSYGTFN